MKKITAFVFMLLIMLCSLSAFAYADDLTTVIFTLDRASVTVNGVEKKLDTPAVAIEGRTYVPVRGLAEALGGTAGWNEATRTVNLKHGNDEIRLTIDSIIAFLNGEEKDLDAPPLIIDGRTLLPARFIAEGFGYRVIWNANRKTVTVTNGSSDIVIEPTTVQTTAKPVAQPTTVKAAEPTTAKPVAQPTTVKAAEPTTVKPTQPATVKEPAAEITTSSAPLRDKLIFGPGPVINPNAPKSGTLVLYFSKTGTTQRIAEIIGRLTGADVIKLETVLPYPSDYNMLMDMAQKEKISGARPELKTNIKNLAYYDTVYIGYPIWLETMPMAMFTFIENNDLSGKTIIPFCTHMGSGLGSSVKDIKAALPDSDVKDGFACNASTTEQEIKNLIGNY